MGKQVFFFLILALLSGFLCSVFAQTLVTQEELIQQEGLNDNPIVSFTVKKVDLDLEFGEVIEQEEVFSYQRIYDSLGNQIEFINGKDINFRFKYNGRLVTEEGLYSDAGELKSKIDYIYDTQGNLVEEAYYRGSELYTKYISEYDAQGNKISTSEYNSSGKLNEKEIYKYDAQGNLIEEALYYGGDGSLLDKKTYSFDTQGNLIEEVEYRDDGTLNVKYVYQYNNQGNLTEKLIYGNQGYQGKEVYKYDDRNNLIEEIFYDANTEYAKGVYKYDDWNNRIEESGYRGDVLVHRGQCSYIGDTRSNWIERICFPYEEKFGEWQPVYDGWQNEKTIRVIEYLE